MKTCIIGILLLMLSTSTQAQVGVPVQQDFMPAMINPALQGFTDGFSASMIYSAQLSGIDGAPTLSALSGAYRFNQHSAGLWVARDAFGRLTVDEVHLQYAHHFAIGEGHVSVGFEGYIQQQSYDFTNMQTPILDDPAIANSTRTFSNIAAGIAYWHQKGYFGLSVKDFIQDARNDDMYAYPKRSYYATGLYVYTLSDTWKILPGFSYRLPIGSPVVLFVQGHVRYDEKIQLDFGYRNASAYHLGLRWNIIPKLQFAYCYTYDAAFTESSGGHDIGLRYGLSFY